MPAPSSGSSKHTAIISDLLTKYGQLEQKFSNIETKSKNILQTIVQWGPAGGAGAFSAPGSGIVSGQMGHNGTSSYNPPGGGGGGGGGGGRSPNGFVDEPRESPWPGAMKKVGLAVAAGAMQAINTSDFIENEMARRRFGFYSGQGGTMAGATAFQGLMNQGTFMNGMEGQRAVMSGASMGLMPGLKNFNTIQGNYATISNLSPGATGEQAASAVASLNSAQSVNRLRMIGINIRGSNGMMRDINDIANDLWAWMKRAHGPGQITVDEISLSLQSGNILDSLLNQYFSGDPILRQSIIAILMQKAQGGGLSKGSLAKTGALPDIATSFGKRAAASYKATNAYTTAGVQGIQDANSVIAAAANTFAESVGVFGNIVRGMSGLETLSGGANGAFGTIMSGVLGGVRDIVGNAVSGAIGRVFKGGTVGGGSAGKGGWKGKVNGTPWFSGAKGMAGLKGNIKGLGAVGTVLTGANLIGDVASGHGWGSKQFSSDLGAGVGGVLGGALGSMLGPWGTVGGAMLGSWVGGMIGEGMGAGGEDPVVDQVFNPLRGELRLGSSFKASEGFRSHWHRGQDFVASTGTKVFAIRGGTAKLRDNGSKGLGKSITIQQDDGKYVDYGHLSNYAIDNNAKISAGELIGYVGHTGEVYPKGEKGSHLHLAVRTGSGFGDDAYTDPMSYMGGKGATPISTGSSSVSGATTPASSSGSSSLSSGVSLFDTGTGSSLFSTAVGGEDPLNLGSKINYGGVTIHINVPAGTAINEQKLAREVKRILEDEEQMRMAVIR